MPDTDADGIADVDELALASNPNDPNSFPPRLAQSKPVAYINTLPGSLDPGRWLFLRHSPILMLRLGEGGNIHFQASPVVSYQNGD